MRMTNKEYQAAKEAHENAYELETFTSYEGMFYRANKYMKPEDLKEIRQAYKEMKKAGAYSLDGFNGRALIIPNGSELILKSYYTEVAKYNLESDEFTKLWQGFSVTTLKHINEFRRFLGMTALSKRDWIEL